MTKVLQDMFPAGISINRTDGLYINEWLKQNLDVMCKAIVNDMDFCIIISGRGKVRVGKSVLAMQIGAYMTWKINQLHNLQNTFTLNDVVFDGEELLERAFKVGKYSVIVFDEAGDDLSTDNHAMQQRIKQIVSFFRKCGQLNLILILVLPDFFDLKPGIAVSRSHALINCKYYGAFERGVFDFYNDDQKFNLYWLGKRTRNYNAVDKSFVGNFTNFYPINEEAYRKKKSDDLKKILLKTPRQVGHDTMRLKVLEYKIHELIKQIDFPVREAAKIMNVGRQTLAGWGNHIIKYPYVRALLTRGMDE